ncbi:MAG: hypothetical protein OEY96_05685 [Gammaproteobacteria bacterium]|nr:hypothetical protein [Gammaproteobacteria bacterium]
MMRLAILTFFLFSMRVYAHQDVALEMDMNGNLKGFPNQYLPAKLDLISYSLRIGKNKIELPECVVRFFNHAESNTLTVSSSWYHDEKRIPYYVLIKIQPKGKDYLFRLLFNLKTLLPMKFEISTPYGKPGPGSRASYTHELKIQDYCWDDIKVKSVQT